MLCRFASVHTNTTPRYTFTHTPATLYIHKILTLTLRTAISSNTHNETHGTATTTYMHANGMK